MTTDLESKDLDRFRDLVAQRFGLHFENGRKDYLGEALVQAIRRTRSATALYLLQLETCQLSREEQVALTRELTVAETHFFRHPDQFRALAELALPELLAAQPSRRRLSVLSAGCASGEETYSLALVLQEKGDLLATWDVRVMGIDVNPGALAKAVQGRFTDWSLRGLSEELRQQYFRPAGKDHLLNDAIRARASFTERNLIENDPTFWQADAFDVIFCRNVLMYFTPEAARAVIARFARSLVPGGFLFVGPAETLRGISQEFHLRHTHNTFYYQRRRPGDNPAPPSTGEEKTALPPAWTPLLPAVGVSWVDAICRASERIAHLGRQPSIPRPDEAAHGGRTDHLSPSRPHPGSPDLGAARELVRQERFDDALQLLQTLSGGQENDPDAQLLQAMILTNRGEVARAKQLCRQVLAGDELNAEAHYLLALCREHGGELPSAIEEDQTATYLAPEFAMPHLHLGLMHKRAGNWAAARLAFRQAGILLPREDPSRILLFGGGFSRETLLQLCRTELRSCGGSS